MHPDFSCAAKMDWFIPCLSTWQCTGWGKSELSELAQLICIYFIAFSCKDLKASSCYVICQLVPAKQILSWRLWPCKGLVTVIGAHSGSVKCAHSGMLLLVRFSPPLLPVKQFVGFKHHLCHDPFLLLFTWLWWQYLHLLYRNLLLSFEPFWYCWEEHAICRSCEGCSFLNFFLLLRAPVVITLSSTLMMQTALRRVQSRSCCA